MTVSARQRRDATPAQLRQLAAEVRQVADFPPVTAAERQEAHRWETLALRLELRAGSTGAR